MGILTGQKQGTCVESRKDNRNGKKRKRRPDPHDNPELSEICRRNGIIIHEEDEDGTEVAVFIPWERSGKVKLDKKKVLSINWDNESSMFNGICHACGLKFHQDSEMEEHIPNCLGKIHKNSHDRLGRFMAKEKAKGLLGNIDYWISGEGRFRTEGTTVVVRAKTN